MSKGSCKTIAIALLIGLAGCGNREKLSFTHPVPQLVKELGSRRLVMLGDFRHGDALSYQSVTSVLSDWVDSLSDRKPVPRHLTLVLEEGDSAISVLRNYIHTGDLGPVIKFWIIDGELERLEFFHDLRRISMRIDSLNGSLQGSRKVSFRLLGGEAVREYSPVSMAMLKWPFTKDVRYFVTMRDSLAALKIESYFESNPDEKGLIFYGTAHLNDMRVNKARAMGLQNTPNGDGYFLAHYLKQYFGRDSVLCVFQEVVTPGSRFAKAVPAQPENSKELLVYHFKEKYQNGSDHYFDAVVFHYEKLTMSHYLYYVFSRRIISDCIDMLKMTNPLLPGFYAKEMHDRAMWGLRLATGEAFRTPGQFEAWYKSHSYDGLARLSSQAFEEPMYSDYRDSNVGFTKRMEVYSTISGLPFSYFSVPARLDSAQFAGSCLGILKKVECGEAIGMYWVGYPDEQMEAHRWLVSYTGKVFATPELYLKWWRHKFFDVDY